MEIKDVYNRFEQVHSYSFSTIDGEYPESRIAHFLTYDEEGLYFMTMKVKPFYRQLIETGKVSVCTVIAEQKSVIHDENGLSSFPPGYFIRVNGNVRELTNEALMKKADNNDKFIPLVKDAKRYPAMTTFVLYRFKGEIYDYDFEHVKREHKIERDRFSFGGMEYEDAGFTINKDTCIACGRCATVCTFGAIIPGEKYSIDGKYCDECGSCYTVCPVDAVHSKVAMEEEYRKECGRKVYEYACKHKSKTINRIHRQDKPT